ncbi:hypothetical protein CEE34_06875 [Candidatus Aerophobetes bacterium Ae_b3a]|nr:MAG: hypothetical protein CEE34_06875 [Candidatus Aerophobetes bacterium Ae_b3a]
MNENVQELHDLRSSQERPIITGPYLRVSTREQEKGKTIEGQRQSILEEKEKRNWLFADWYIDDGYSGELQARPGMDRLLFEIEEKKIEVVPMIDPERLGRSFLIQKILEAEIKERGARVEYLSMPPPKTEDEELAQDIRGLLGGWERLKIRRRTMTGKLMKAKSGLFVGGKSPYGFRYLGKTRQTPACYEPIEEQIHWVKEIFRWYAWEGLSAEAIAKRLSNRKVLTPFGNHLWCSSTVHYILTNETYAGIAHYNRHRAVPPKNRQTSTGYRRMKNTSREIRAEKEWISIPVTPIIDRDLWDRVQVKLRRNAKTSPRNTRHPYLLRGKVVCGICGSPCYGSVSRSTLRYQCGNRHRMFPQPKTCSARSVSASTLDSTIWQSLCQALSHPDSLISELRKVQEQRSTTGDFRQKEFERLERELEKRKKAEERLLDLYTSDEQMTPDQYKDRVDRIRIEKREIETQKRQIERQMKKTIDLNKIEEQIKFLYAHISSRLDMLSLDEKKRIVDLLVDRVIVVGNEVKIEGIIPPLGNIKTNRPDNVAIASQLPQESV